MPSDPTDPGASSDRPRWRHSTNPPRGAAARRERGWAQELGVTVSELILVVVFIAGLIAVAAWAVSGINAETSATNCETALRNLKMATEQYHAENDAYPVDKAVLIDLGYVEDDDVSGWHLELSNAVTPTYTGTGSCG